MTTKRTVAGIALATALSWATGAQADGYSLKDSPAPFSWTGLYIGVHGGAAWGHASVTDTTGGVDPGPFHGSGTAAFGGGTLGYNLQRGPLVFGVEADLGYMDQLAHGVIPSSNPIHHQDATVRGGLYGDITGRAGITVERTLIYAKGGFAFFDGQGRQVTTKPGYAPTGTNTFTGWVIGGGVEHALGHGWSVKAEYLHYDFGHQSGYQTSISDPPIGFQYNNKFDLTADTIKVGLNYRF